MIAQALKSALLFILALGLSVLVWVIAQVEQNPEVREDVRGVAVELRNIPNGVEVAAGGQAAVTLLVSAPQNVWSRMDSRSFRAWADLADLEAGRHDVTVSVLSQERGARVVSVTPPYITVELERMKQKVVPVVVSILDDAPPGYSLGPAVVTPTQILVSGRQSVVDQVTEAVAVTRVEGARSDIRRPARPIARDGRGGEVQGNLTLTPDTVTVTVPVFQLLSYKTVAIRAVITGTVAAGYRITGVRCEPQTITLGGDPRILESIAYLDSSPVDISGARSDVTKPARFDLPPGVATDRRPEVYVDVKIEPIPGQEIIRRPVAWTNLPKDMTVVAPVTPTVDIELAGPLAELARLTSSDITVTISLSGVAPGVVERVPIVNGLPKTLTVVRLVPEKFIILVDVVKPTPTPTPKPTITPTSTPTPLLTPTPTPSATPTPRAWAPQRLMSVLPA